MPVPLPLQPAGINLPAQPQNLPTLDDVVAAKRFQSQVDVAVGQPRLLLTQFMSLTDMHSISASRLSR